MKNNCIILLSAFFLSVPGFSQSPDTSRTLTGDTAQVNFFSLEPAPYFHKGRFWISAGSGAAIYTGFSIALWNLWYKDYPLTTFHTFNDWGEWKDVDKAGHFLSAYIESYYVFKGARWTGMKRRPAMWTAMAVGTGLQATVEVMDGFSEAWGFSLGDIGFNTLGVSLFAAQELLWNEQRIIMKISSSRPDYPAEPVFATNGAAVTTLQQRADELYGSSFTQVFFKDYNAMTIWSSVNLHAFAKNKTNTKLPSWLNLAIGYGAGNIYGGFDNRWTAEDGATFAIDPVRHARYRRFLLSPDVDWSKIQTRHKWLKFSLGLLNWIKVPAPALEWRTSGGLKFYSFYY